MFVGWIKIIYTFMRPMDGVGYKMVNVDVLENSK